MGVLAISSPPASPAYRHTPRSLRYDALPPASLFVFWKSSSMWSICPLGVFFLSFLKSGRTVKAPLEIQLFFCRGAHTPNGDSPFRSPLTVGFLWVTRDSRSDQHPQRICSQLWRIPLLLPLLVIPSMPFGNTLSPFPAPLAPAPLLHRRGKAGTYPVVFPELFPRDG